MQGVRGSLEITALEGTKLHNQDFMGKMDPYVEINVDGHTDKSPPIESGGKDPRFDHTFQVPIAGNFPSTLEVRVMDADKHTKDDLVGFAHVDLEEVRSKGHADQWVKLESKHLHRHKGDLHLAMRFNPAPGQSGGAAPAEGGYQQHSTTAHGASAIGNTTSGQPGLKHHGGYDQQQGYSGPAGGTTAGTGGQSGLHNQSSYGQQQGYGGGNTYAAGQSGLQNPGAYNQQQGYGGHVGGGTTTGQPGLQKHGGYDQQQGYAGQPGQIGEEHHHHHHHHHHGGQQPGGYY